jgi:hypothetical protein
MSYRVDVLASGESKYVSNGIRLATRKEATAYGEDISGRWMAVKDWKIVASKEPANYKWNHGLEKK